MTLEEAMQETSLKVLAEKCTPDLLRLLPKSKQEALYAYLLWEKNAQGSYGLQFTHQAFKNPSPPTQSSNTRTDTSSRLSL